MSTQPVGLSTQLAPKQVMRARLDTADLAVWRSASGVVSAWENRCPHRGMRLSHGFVRGESLACAYHGWHYDCSGSCTKIPAHPELEPPNTIRVASYSVLEHSGVVWVDTTDTVQPVDLPDNLIAVRSLTFKTDRRHALESFSSISPSADSFGFASSTTVSSNPLVLSFSDDEKSDCVWIAFQASGPHSTVCHVLALQTLTGEELVGVSKGCEAARRFAEKSAEKSAEKPVAKSADQFLTSEPTDSDG